MNYAEMSDFEINKLVGSATCEATVSEPVFNQVIRNSNGKEFNPCNSWADAGPIIEKNRISIEFDGDDTAQWCHTISCEGLYGIEYQSNPLRAAMITFLLIQESK